MKKYLLIIACLFIMSGVAEAIQYDFSWEAPTKNDDGTMLTDLDGYNFYEDGNKVKDVKNVLLHCAYRINVYAFRRGGWDFNVCKRIGYW